MNEPAIRMKKRLFYLFLILMAFYLAIEGRLGYIQILKHDTYGKMAEQHQTRDIVLPSVRGAVTDRKGNKLIFSLQSYTVWANIKDVVDRKDAAQKLAPYLGISADDILKTLNSGKTNTRIGKEKIQQALAVQIRELKIPGISVEQTVKRVYPKGSLASQVLGITSDDDEGISGIEQQYNKELHGVPGMLTVRGDAMGRQLPTGELDAKPPKDGYTVQLTIDEVIQHYAEQALEASMPLTHAASATAIVMDVRTGEVLAMASKPDFDPNNPRVPLDPVLKAQMDSTTDEKVKVDIWTKMWQNRAVNWDYEPGSVFKLVTYSAGLDTGAANENTDFLCQGFLQIAGWPKPIKCWYYPKSHGHENMVMALKNSCNPAAMEMEQKLGIDRFWQYLNQFQAIDKTGIDLPGERAVIHYEKKRMGPVEQATMSFGHGISMTPMRMLDCAAAIGNGGKVMEPHMVRALLDSEGNIVKSIAPKVTSQAIRPETAARMLAIMEQVVKGVPHLDSYIQGYRIGGKTGTSNKAVNGTYDVSRVVASFTAIAPIDNPQIAIIVVVDDPRTTVQFGSYVAAPIGLEILQNTLTYMQIPQENAAATQIIATPNLSGMSLEDAKKNLTAKKLSWTLPDNILDETALVIGSQYPKPGVKVAVGTRIILYPKSKTGTATKP